MMPVYRYMDSYPHQGNQMSSGQIYYPSLEVVPPLTKFDPSNVINQPWPYPSSMNYSVPCYPQSTDAHFPGYYGNGFYPHSPIPQFHCCGHHLPFPSPFPAQCVPPYYLKELPRYEYDKPRDNGYHCCGCPNHSHNQNSGGGVRIEEQEPNRGHTLVPSKLENYPHPVLLIPPEYMKNNEHKKHVESDGATQEKPLGDMKPHHNVNPHEQAPQERRSWLPLDLKNLQSLLQGDDGKGNWDQKDENNMQQFPFPIIWMTPKSKQGEDNKEEQGKMDGIPTNFKDSVRSNIASSVKLLSNDHGMNKAQEIQEDVSANSEPKEKGTTQKIIHVKPVEVIKERENSEGSERRGRPVSPKKRNDGEMDKSSGHSARRDSSSPPKSKLPPVCLRVDPLPRKKSSSMSSRSPSPPGIKGKPQDKVQTCQSTLSSNKETEEKNSRGVAMQVAERKRDEEKNESRMNDSTGVPVGSLVDSSNRERQQIEKNDFKSTADGKQGLESRDESSSKEANEEQEANYASICGGAAIVADKKKLSVDEAALRIQATYRGYQVRKWEPLKKLKQIAEVREQMIELRSKIQGLESTLDLVKDEKQSAVIGEMIMRLLLKLDTIQGLNPSFRDVRKSLARELVMFQEKLDSLTKAKLPNNQEGKFGDAKEHSIDDIPQSVGSTSKNQNKKTSKPPHAVEDEQIDTVNDVQIVDRGLKSPSNEWKEEVDGELDSNTAVEHNQAANEGILPLALEKSGFEKMNCAQESISKVDGLQGLFSKELVASAEEPMEKVILENCSPTKIDDSGDAAQVVEMLNELPVEVIEAEESLQHKQAGLPENDAPLLDGDVKEKEPVGVPEGLPTKDALLELEDVSDPTEQQAMLESSEVAEVSNKNEPEFTPVVGPMNPVNGEEADNNFTGENVMGGENLMGGNMQDVEGSEVVKTNESLLEETQEASPLQLEEGDGDEMQKEVINVGISNVEEEKGGDNQDSVCHPSEEHVSQGESREQETINMLTNQLDMPESSKDEVSSVITDKLLPSQEGEISREESRKLVEESEKMREVVNKLLESGKQQFAVISNLTGRLNELEHKLRHTKRKARRHRTAILLKPSARKQSVNAVV